MEKENLKSLSFNIIPKKVPSPSSSPLLYEFGKKDSASPPLKESPTLKLLQKDHGPNSNSYKILSPSLTSPRIVIQTDTLKKQERTFELLHACFLGDISKVKQLILDEKIDPSLGDYDCRTPLHLASEEGHLEIVKFLIPLIKDKSPIDKFRNTPLGCAIKNGHKNVIDYLKESGSKTIILEDSLDFSKFNKPLDTFIVERYRGIFDNLGPVNDIITAEAFEEYLESRHIRKDKLIEQLLYDHFEKKKMNWSYFIELMNERTGLFYKICKNHFAIPNWDNFLEIVKQIYDVVEKNNSGSFPKINGIDYDKDSFEIAIVTIDGQVFEWGSSNKCKYPINSCISTLLYCLAIEEHGIDYIHKLIGREPSDSNYTEINLNPSSKPHNPYIYSGNLVVCSTILPKENNSARYRKILSSLYLFNGDAKTFSDNSFYLTNKENETMKSLAFYICARKAMPNSPNDIDINRTIDFLYQSFSLQTSTLELATYAATFANKGKNPLTGKDIMSKDYILQSLHLSYSCGMVNESGDWSYTCGVPTQTGLQGAIYISVPGICGVAVYSPLVNEYGNSIRGMEFCKRLANTMVWSTFQNLYLKRKDNILE